MKLHKDNTLGELGSAIGKGLLAGVAATAAMTISQLIEMKITNREASDAPVKIAQDTAGIKLHLNKINNNYHKSYTGDMAQPGA